MKLDPNSTKLPKRSELPAIPGAPEGAAWFWGDDDEVCRTPPDIVIEQADAVRLNEARPTEHAYARAQESRRQTHHNRRDHQSRVRDRPPHWTTRFPVLMIDFPLAAGEQIFQTRRHSAGRLSSTGSNL